MASLEQRFQAIQRESPHHSSLINFNRAIQGVEMSQGRLNFYFRKLVDKGDYAKEDYKEIRTLYTSKIATQKQRFFSGLGLETGQLCPA